MKVILFGATGMVGQGVLRETLLDPQVKHVLAVGRHPVQQRYSKLKNLVLENLSDYSRHAREFHGYDACFFCLGVSSAGMSEEQYAYLTYDLTLAAAKALSRKNRRMTFVYVSGAGTDETETGSVMWARVKGRTENALLKLPFRRAYMFRPSLIQPMHGEVSRTGWYRMFYSLSGWTFPALRVLFPRSVTTTENMGRAMLRVAKEGYSKERLGPVDINLLARP